MRHRFEWVVVVIALASAAPAVAAAQSLYFGHHPVPPGQGAFCVVNGSHSHPYAPDNSVAHLFRIQNGQLYFVGDPYHFGYGRPAFGFDGHHPIHPAFGGGWCYIDGPHHHFFHPHRDEVRQYTSFGGRYYYLGVVGPEYATQRAAFYVETPPYAAVAAYAPLYDARFHYAVSYGRPASVAYVVRGRLPRRYYVPGVYAGAYFGLPGFAAGVAVATPGLHAQVGVALPAVGFGSGVAPVGPGVVVARGPAYYERVPPGWHHGKKKGWYKKRWHKRHHREERRHHGRRHKRGHRHR